MKLSFTKMQGCANDYIYLDCRTSGVPEDIAALSQKLSRRHFSIGADGIICICAPGTEGADGRMRIFNADGSEALPAVNMGEGPLVDCPLTVEGRTWHVTCISVGNPHCVTVVEDVDCLKLEDIGPAFERHANFPERVNTEFVEVVDATHLKMRVWERGSGETWACGTGTCATVAALTELGLCPAGEDVHVQLRGGELIIRVLPDKKLLMTGSAVTVCEGTAEV